MATTIYPTSSLHHHHHLLLLFPNHHRPPISLAPPPNPSSSPFATLSLALPPHRPLHHHHLHATASAFSTDDYEDDGYDADSSGDEEGYEDEDYYSDEQDQSPRGAAARRGDRGAGRIYVGNLPYSMTPKELREVFSQAGPVEAADVVYDRITDRSRGFAFVTMAGADEANAAIRMFDGAQLGGRTVKVNFPEVPRGGEREVMGPTMRGSGRDFIDSAYQVYAGNLAWSVTSESLRKAFEGVPGMLGAKVIYDLNSGRSRGFGFVSFASQEEASSAIDYMNAALEFDFKVWEMIQVIEIFQEFVPCSKEDSDSYFARCNQLADIPKSQRTDRCS